MGYIKMALKKSDDPLVVAGYWIILVVCLVSLPLAGFWILLVLSAGRPENASLWVGLAPLFVTGVAWVFFDVLSRAYHNKHCQRSMPYLVCVILAGAFTEVIFIRAGLSSTEGSRLALLCAVLGGVAWSAALRVTFLKIWTRPSGQIAAPACHKKGAINRN